jgi:hypothetical protein
LRDQAAHTLESWRALYFRMRQRITSFSDPVLVKELFLNVGRPTRYVDATTTRIEEDRANGKKVRARIAETTAGGKTAKAGKGAAAPAGGVSAFLKSAITLGAFGGQDNPVRPGLGFRRQRILYTDEYE